LNPEKPTSGGTNYVAADTCIETVNDTPAATAIRIYHHANATSGDNEI